MKLYEKIGNDLREAIADGGLKPGHRVPSVNELCSQYRVSNITINRVYRELAKDNLIERLGKSYTVCSEPAVIYREKRTDTIGFFLRPPRLYDPRDNHFNIINTTIHRELTRHGFNLYMPNCCFCLDKLVSMTPAKLEEFGPAMLECADSVDAFIVDERIPDEILSPVVEKTGKPMIIVDRCSKLPVDTVMPPNRENLFHALDLARQLGYDAIIYIASGQPKYNSIELSRFFQEYCEAEYFAPENTCRIEGGSFYPLRTTLDSLDAAIQKLQRKNCKTLLFSETGGLYESLLEYVQNRPELQLTRNFGIMLSCNFGYLQDIAVKPAILGSNPEQIGVEVVKNLLWRLENPAAPPGDFRIPPEFIPGNSLYTQSSHINGGNKS